MVPLACRVMLLTLCILAVCRTGMSQVLLVGPNNTVFSVPADQPVTAQPQSVLVESNPAKLPFEYFEALLDGSKAGTSNFVVVSPASGVTPAPVKVSLNPNVVPYMAPGVYTLSLGFRSTDPGHPGFAAVEIALSLQGSGIPPAISSIVNSASQQAAFTPGELVTIYGSNLGTQPVSATEAYSTGFGDTVLYPTNLGNTTVTFAGFPAPLLYVSPTQINAVIPYQIIPGVPISPSVIVTHNNLPSSAVTIQTAITAPGVFTVAANGQGQGAIANVDPQSGAVTVNSAANPAPKGSTIVLYATGAGIWNQSSANGAILTNVLDPPGYFPQAPVSLMIGGQPATVLYAGAAPNQVSGVLQVNAVVPPGAGWAPSRWY